MKVNYWYIKACLKARKINLKAECVKHGVSYNTVCKVLYEERPNCRINTLIFLATILETDINNLLEQEEN